MTRLYRQRWTYCGVMVAPGIVLFLVNDAARSTKAMVAYDDLHPVRIMEKLS